MAPEDLDEVLKIEAASFPKPWTRNQFESELRNPISSAFILRLDKESRALVGYTVFWVVHGEAHILNIAIHPEYRGRGLAKCLLRAVLDVMKRRMVYEVFLEVRVSNKTAISLYKRFGFREAFIRKKYYGDEDAIVMTLEL